MKKIIGLEMDSEISETGNFIAVTKESLVPVVSIKELERIILGKVCYWDVIPLDRIEKVISDKKWFDAFIEGRDAAVEVLVKELNLKFKTYKQAGVQKE